MSYPAYTSSRISQLAQLWSSLTGLDYSVAQAQITAEQGVNGNPVGLENGSGQLMTFPTQEAGLQAAALNLKTNPAYAALRNAISTGNPAVQAHALAASPWGPSGYYAGSPAFSALLTASPGPGTGTSGSSGMDLNPLDILRNLNAGVQQMHSAMGNPSAPGLAAVPTPNTLAAAAGAAGGAAAQAAAQAAGSVLGSAINWAGLAPIAIGLLLLLVIAWLALTGVKEMVPIP